MDKWSAGCQPAPERTLKQREDAGWQPALQEFPDPMVYRNQTMWLGALIVGIVMLTAGSTALAQTDGKAQTKRNPGEVSNVVEELSQEIYSPYCPGKTLAMCPSGGAAKVRREIQDMAEEGMTKQQIKDQVIEEHGEEFRYEKPPAKDNYPLLGMIIAGLLLCGFAVWWFTRRREEDASETDDPEGPVPDDDEDLSDEDEMYLDEIRSQYRD
jgi:cytochrome c-type biogenesis protein CcmH/NrfF